MSLLNTLFTKPIIFARAFAPARKQYWIGLLLTLNNISDSGAISVTERGCTASISKAESRISDKSVHTVSDSFLFWHEKLSATITTTTTTTVSTEYVKKAITALDLIPAAKQQLCKCSQDFL